jgi:hypothetical protein
MIIIIYITMTCTRRVNYAPFKYKLPEIIFIYLNTGEVNMKVSWSGQQIFFWSSLSSKVNELLLTINTFDILYIIIQVQFYWVFIKMRNSTDFNSSRWDTIYYAMIVNEELFGATFYNVFILK